MPQPSVARGYARFVLGLALDQVPSPVAAKATPLALDTLGSCLASSREDFGRAVLQPADGLDFDDTREDAIVHTGLCRGQLGSIEAARQKA